ncbi:MAG: SUF system Fe-S cluster assembly protein [Gammaproteobacteria bacterium]|jgi:FeS assembly SUF system protein|nr:MAG: SUF system Fe-S cluster assembly protein [Gammaproteobacteria bacterium]
MDRQDEAPQDREVESATVQLDSSDTALEQLVVAALRSVYDPEIPVNIYDLGLIYVVHIDEHSVVNVQMTLTAPACPVAGTLPGQVENVLRQVEGVRDASVELVWDPPWDQERMSEEARLTLGML